MNLLPPAHLPRLNPGAYQGFQFVHWTMTIAGRRTGWLGPDFHDRFRHLLTSTCSLYHVAVPVYCLMPDHLHVVAAGTRAEADQQLWCRAVRRKLGASLHPLTLQKQAFDHVLRPAESRPDAFTQLSAYVLSNPVRAALIGDCERWPYAGCCLPAMRGLDVHSPDYWERWWGYWRLVTTSASDPESHRSNSRA